MLVIEPGENTRPHGGIAHLERRVVKREREKSVGPQRSCDFRSGRMILQQPVERVQMHKLLATGRTDLLTGFMSKKNRKFKAFLVKTPPGKIGFEFLPRAEKPGKPQPEKEPAAEKRVKKAAAKKATAKPAKKKRSA